MGNLQPIRALAIGIAAFSAGSVGAQDTLVATADGGIEVVLPANAVATWQADPSRVFTADEVDLDDFRWIARPLVVFGESPADPNFQRQMALLAQRPAELVERDVIVITDTDPDGLSDLRRQLRPRAFMLALVDKDGRVALRKPLPWDIRELSRSIDKMPLRQQEIDERRGS